MGRVAGKVALVTGGGRGMGAAHARLLAAEGAKVVIGDVIETEGNRVAEEIGENARFVHLDVTDQDQWQAAVGAATDAFGKLDVLVNNAGIATYSALATYRLEQWRKVIDVNLTGAFLGIQAVIEPMKAAGGGSIINISSIEGIRGSAGLAGYVASKYGVIGLAKTAALELAEHNIRVNSVLPGLVRTRMAIAIPDDSLQIPLGRGAKPAEISTSVVFLASDESSYMTGAEIVLDGGLSVGVPQRG